MHTDAIHSQPNGHEGAQTLNPMFNTKQAASYLGYKSDTLRKWRQQGKGPVFLKRGRDVRYRLSDLNAFIPGESYSNTAEAYYGLKSQDLLA